MRKMCNDNGENHILNVSDCQEVAGLPEMGVHLHEFRLMAYVTPRGRSNRSRTIGKEEKMTGFINICSLEQCVIAIR
jgi:hypothetical protein